MKRIVMVLAVMLLAVSFMASGCVIAKINGAGSNPVLLNGAQKKVEVIKHMTVSKQIMFDYTKSYDVSAILAKAFEETKADAMINCRVSLKSTPADFFVNLFTLGFANSITVEIEGDAVKTPNGLSELNGSSIAINDIANSLPVGGEIVMLSKTLVKGDNGIVVLN